MATKKQVKTTSRDAVTTYARQVISGNIIAGPHVKSACERHLRDLKQAPERGFFFDLDKANRAIGFFKDVLKLNGGQYEGQAYELLPWQLFIVGSLFGWVDANGLRRFRIAYIETAKGSGKSPLAAGIGLYGLVADNEARAEVYAAAPLALNTLVPTPSGWTTQGELKVGDQVFSEDGNPCHVTYLSPILTDQKCFEIEFDDGTVIVSDENHLWSTIDTRGQTPRHYKPNVVTTKKISETLRSPLGRLRHWIKLANPLNTNEIDLPIDPYTLGVWLGDGRVSRGAICYHKNDSQPIEKIKSAGYEVSTMGGQNDTRYGTIIGLRTQLRKLGLLENKHVPDIYLRASKQQRQELLSGLMDTDGTCTKTGECRFTNREKRLAIAVHDLAIGLGIKAHFREIEVTGTPHYIVSFKAAKNLRIFELERKYNRQREFIDARATGRYIKEIRPCKSVPVRCIEVNSKSHLYLVTRSHIATHNTKKDQAMVLFRDAVAMVDQSPVLAKALVKSGIGASTWNLAYHKAGSFFRPISADDGQSGPRPHIVLLDEIHEHKTATVVEMLRAGTKSREQAMIVMITNSGHDKQSVCWNYHEAAIHTNAAQNADDKYFNDQFFGYVCALDKDDDPFKDEQCWYKANPSLAYGLPGLKYLREQVTEAKGMPSKESIVRRLNFCEWTEAENPWISSQAWFGCEDKSFDFDLLYDRRCFAGLDLSSTQDLTALVLLFEPAKHDEHWRLVPYFWLPGDGLWEKADKDRVPYVAWRDAGYLEALPGKAINKLAVMQRCAEICSMYDVQNIGFDRWRIEDFKMLMDQEGVSLPLSPFGQGFKDMAPAVDVFESLIINQQLRHNGNPVMNWCAANAVISTDPAGNRKVTKEKATGRVDGIVAAIMAAGKINSESGTGIIEQAFVVL